MKQSPVHRRHHCYRQFAFLALACTGVGAAAQGTTGEKQLPNLAPVTITSERERPDGPVEGYVARRSGSATKTDIPLIESPQSISVISRDQMEDRGSQGLTEAVTYSPGIYTDNRASSSVIDSNNTEIRGFSAADATYRNGTQRQAGLPYDSPVEVYGLERIEILRGPASMLYGQGQPGGVINMVSKQPTAEPFAEVGIEYGSDNHRQLTGDVSDALNSEGTLRYRLTGLVQESDSHIDYVNDDRVYVAPALTWEPDADTRLTLLAHYQKNETRYPWSAFPREGTKEPSEHGRIPDSRYIGEPSFDRYDAEEQSVEMLLEQQLTDSIAFHQNLRYRTIEYDVLDTFRDYFGPYLQPDGRTLNRDNRARFDEGDTLTSDTRFIIDANTGPVDHQFLVGVDYKTLTYDTRDSGFMNGLDKTLDLYDPNYGGDFSTPSSFETSRTEADQLGVYVQDHLKFGQRWVATLGSRYDDVSEETDSGSEDQSEFSHRAGLVYLAPGGFAPYASYSESFSPQYGSDSVTGESYDPVTASQYEAGLRYQPDDQLLSASIAAFRIERDNELVEDPNNSTRSIQIGETRSEGVELGLNAELTGGWKGTLAYTYQNVEVVESGGEGATNGKQLSEKPQHLAKAWIDYTVQNGRLQGLGIGTGVRYTGTSWADADNTIKYPASTQVDASVSYDLADTSFQLSVNNLFDEQPIYCSGRSADSICEYGVPRSIVASITHQLF